MTGPAQKLSDKEAMSRQHAEWFWSEDSAKRAAKRLEAKGYATKVRYAMAADGRSDWLLEAFA